MEVIKMQLTASLLDPRAANGLFNFPLKRVFQNCRREKQNNPSATSLLFLPAKKISPCDHHPFEMGWKGQFIWMEVNLHLKQMECRQSNPFVMITRFIIM